MKKITRFGTIISFLGISFVILAIIRGSATYNYHIYAPITPGTWSSTRFFAFPRDLKLVLEPTGSHIKIFDPCGTLILDVENVTGTCTVHISKRGTHELAIFNPFEVTVNFQVELIFYNLERDLVQVSIILIASGTALTVAEYTYSKIKRTRI